MGKRARNRRIFIKQSILLLVLAVVLWFGIDAAQQYYAERDLIVAQFTLPSGKKTSELHVRVAKKEAQRRQGLMYVHAEELRGERGMLFAFPTEKQQSFWMKDTPAPLDIIFVNNSRSVVGIIENAKPYSSENRSVDAPSIYVVELLAGTAAAQGIVKGALLTLPKDLPVGE